MYAHCKICLVDFFGGLCDIKCHMETKRHTDGAETFNNQSTVTSLLHDKQQSLDKQVITAELLFHNFYS